MNIKKLLLVVLVFAAFSAFSQDDKKVSFGITAGFNYNSNGEYVTEGTLTELAQQFKSEKKTGYHGGIYVQYKTNGMYIRPEVLYIKTKSSYSIDDESNDFDQTKIELPILVGFDIIKPVSIFVGPSFQYTLENELEDIEVENIDIQSELAVNFQAGLAIQIHDQIRVDIRYEKGISNNILSIKDDTNAVIGSIDTKPEQIILSVSFKL